MKKYYPLSITKEQRKNLELLYENSPKTIEIVAFDMFEFLAIEKVPINLYDFITDKIISAETSQCGAVACFAGRGPLCGIPRDTSNADWYDYVENNFGVDIESRSFTWLFSADWTEVDNTLEGARKRLEIALDKGVPEDAYKQSIGEAPLEYVSE